MLIGETPTTNDLTLFTSLATETVFFNFCKDTAIIITLSFIMTWCKKDTDTFFVQFVKFPHDTFKCYLNATYDTCG